MNSVRFTHDVDFAPKSTTLFIIQFANCHANDAFFGITSPESIF